MTEEERYLLAMRLMWFTIAAKGNPEFNPLRDKAVKEILAKGHRMTYREPYEMLTRPSYKWGNTGWARSATSSVTPYRRHMLKLIGEALVRNVPLVTAYHGQVRGDAGPLVEETSERRVLEEGRQMTRWMDNTGGYQRGGRANRGTTFAAQKVGKL